MHLLRCFCRLCHLSNISQIWTQFHDNRMFCFILDLFQMSYTESAFWPKAIAPSFTFGQEILISIMSISASPSFPQPQDNQKRIFHIHLRSLLYHTVLKRKISSKIHNSDSEVQWHLTFHHILRYKVDSWSWYICHALVITAPNLFRSTNSPYPYRSQRFGSSHDRILNCTPAISIPKLAIRSLPPLLQIPDHPCRFLHYLHGNDDPYVVLHTQPRQAPTPHATLF